LWHRLFFKKTGGFTPSTLSTIEDYIIWFAKDKNKIKFRPLFNYEEFPPINDPNYSWLELGDGSIRRMTADEKSRKINLPPKARIFRHGPLNSQGASNTPQEFEFEGKIYLPCKK
jgi:adenine-specific DNA-methyltransferase